MYNLFKYNIIFYKPYNIYKRILFYILYIVLNIEIIVNQCTVPVIVDAGVGTASDVAIAMELGCDGVLLNSAVARSNHPINMAKAMRLAIEAGRLAYRSGRIPKQKLANSSTSFRNMISKKK